LKHSVSKSLGTPANLGDLSRAAHILLDKWKTHGLTAIFLVPEMITAEKRVTPLFLFEGLEPRFRGVLEEASWLKTKGPLCVIGAPFETVRSRTVIITSG
jgi:hypothetical protein